MRTRLIGSQRERGIISSHQCLAALLSVLVGASGGDAARATIASTPAAAPAMTGGERMKLLNFARRFAARRASAARNTHQDSGRDRAHTRKANTQQQPRRQNKADRRSCSEQYQYSVSQYSPPPTALTKPHDTTMQDPHLRLNRCCLPSASLCTPTTAPRHGERVRGCRGKRKLPLANSHKDMAQMLVGYSA